MATSPTTEWLTPPELADELRLPVRTLYDWKLRGVGPPGVRIGRHLRYDRRAVDAWLNDQIASQQRAIVTTLLERKPVG
jgi:excisionase family DNA binding protein